jgi:aspartate racemase
MKTIGLLGGMSWQSTVEYYRIINELVSERLDKLHSAKCIICSLDFEEMAENMRKNNWGGIKVILAEYAKKLEEWGSDAVLICTNTMHKVADDVSKAINIPLINIIDVTADTIKSSGLKKSRTSWYEIYDGGRFLH